jgi:predicted ArsR family transcriptional regulator
MAMCQAMMTSVSKSAEMAAYATPEVRTLFEEWARSVEEEILTILKAQGQRDLGQLAAGLRISPESALVLLGKLVREGKVTISGIQTTGESGRA